LFHRRGWPRRVLRDRAPFATTTVTGPPVANSASGANAGIGFAIPVYVVDRIVPELIRSGRVLTPGISIAAANEAITARLGADGVVVVLTVPPIRRNAAACEEWIQNRERSAT
jgi:S1-C subfamily serine protease